MADNSILSYGTGAGLATVATVVLGPILGEYSIIVGFGLLGTLIALSESVQPTILKSLIFLARGVVLSFVFTGLITMIIVNYLPSNLGATPFVIMGIVAFLIGWLSDRATIVKDSIVNKILNIISFNKKSGS